MLSTLPAADSTIFDLHNNGATLPARTASGAKVVAFNAPDLSLDDVQAVVGHIREQGTTLILPTIITTSSQVVMRNVALIAEAMEKPWGEVIGGIHLEGPFINRETRGAHPMDLVQEKPDAGFISSAFEAAKGRIALVTLSPNIPNANSFIEYIRRLGIEVSLGHHTAEPRQIEEALLAGARGITHLGNASERPIRGKAESFLAQMTRGNDTYVMLIPDGVHLSADFLRDVSTIVESLRADHTIWVSDSSPLATAPIGTAWSYDGRVSTVICDEQGRVRPEPLSGSHLLLPQCLKRLRKMNIVPENLVVAGAGQNPLNFMRETLTRIHGLKEMAA